MMNNQKIIQEGYFKFLINEEKKTAGIVSCILKDKCITIPTKVRSQSQIYIITSILGGSFSKLSNLETIKFQSDAQIQTIEKGAFSESSIESLTIPPTLIELKDGWCNGTSKLNKVEVSPENPRYSTYNENKFIIGKSSSEKENYDSIVFCARDVKTVTIPNFIEIIEPYAFNKCSQLFEIIFPFDSKIQSIGCCAFSDTLIQCFTIPSFLIDLKKGWCEKTSKLTEIKILPNNPRYSLFNEKFIIGKSSIDNENYDILVFSARDISSANIPSFIEIIDQSAFQQCNLLREVKFSEDSKLRIIEKLAFNHTSIATFSIPSQTTIIGELSFSENVRLKNFEIPKDSKLQTIENLAFYMTILKKISISRHITNIGSNSFRFCKSLRKVEIPPDSELHTIGENAFEAASIGRIFIPSQITEIADSAFRVCRRLCRVEIANDSKIEKIGKYAFYKSNIKRFAIPVRVTKICEYAFSECRNLNRIEIPLNSELQIIEKGAFNGSSIGSIVFPPHLIQVGESAFAICAKLRAVEINENCQIKLIEAKMFSSYRHLSIFIDVNLKITIH